MTRGIVQTSVTAADSSPSARVDVAQLVQLAVRGLVPMFDPEAQLFCHRLKQGSNGLGREGLSERYTIMSVLGLWRFEESGRGRSPVPVRRVFDRLSARPTWVNSLGDLGLLLWLCALASPEKIEDMYSEFGVNEVLSKFPEARVGTTMDLAWFLTGLSYASLTKDAKLHKLSQVALQTVQLLTRNQGDYGFFGHAARDRSLRGFVRGRIGSFADQVYPIYALARFGQAFQDQESLNRSRRCAEAICRAQGLLGQWWWHYDASSGKVFQRYPVYAVHQEGMAPMALFALGDATRLDFSESIYRGLAWIGGDNELNCDLREGTLNLVWRDVHRRNRLKMYLREFADHVAPGTSDASADDLGVNRECRPYELGWLLYAFAGRDSE